VSSYINAFWVLLQCTVDHTARDRAIIVVVLLCLNSDSQPVCGPVVRRSSVTESESVDFTCSMTYKWKPRQSNIYPDIRVSFGWEGASETPTTKTLSSSSPGGSEEANMTIASATGPLIPTQKCTISFTFSRRQHLTRQYDVAINTVSYTCATDPIQVLCKCFALIIQRIIFSVTLSD